MLTNARLEGLNSLFQAARARTCGYRNAATMANIGQHDSGIFFCTGGFSRDAENYARSQESKRIMLIDSAKLVQLWTDNIPRLNDQAWQRLPLTPIYFLTPEG